MQLSHDRPVGSVKFDEPNLVALAGLVPLVALAQSCGLGDLADAHLSVPGDTGSNAGLKVTSLVAGMAAGADCIDDMAILRHGGMGRVFDRAYAPSTLGSFLRSFAFGHVRQLDAVASRLLGHLASATPLVAGIDDLALVDVDDTIVEVHGDAKQGAGFGLLRQARPERSRGDRYHDGQRAGDRGDPAAQGLGELRPWRRPAHRRRVDDREATEVTGHDRNDRDRDGAAASRLRLLRTGQRSWRR